MENQLVPNDSPPVALPSIARRREMLALVALGIDRSTAAYYVGWHDFDYPRLAVEQREFVFEIARFERQFEVAQLRRLAYLAEKHWNAAAWLLERRYPERYARPTSGIRKEELEAACDELIRVILREIADPVALDRIELALRRHLERSLFPAESDDDL